MTNKISFKPFGIIFFYLYVAVFLKHVILEQKLNRQIFFPFKKQVFENYFLKQLN